MSTFVMIIDDSLTVRKILEVCLHRAGYSVESFCGGVEMFRWLNTAQAAIPKPAFAQTVFVILSRRDGVLDRLKGRLAGASVYLTKPCKTQEIVAVVQTYLGPPVGRNTIETYC